MKFQSKFFLMSTAFLMTIATNAMAGGGEPCANGGQGGKGGQGCTVVSQRDVQVKGGRVVTEYVLRSDAGELVTRYRDNEDRIVVLSRKEKRHLDKADRIEDRMEDRVQNQRNKAAVYGAEISSRRAENSAIARSLGGKEVSHVVTSSVSTSASSSSTSVAVDHSNDQFPRPVGGCPNGMYESGGVCYGANLFSDGPCEDEVVVSQSSEGKGGQGNPGKGGQGNPGKTDSELKPVETSVKPKGGQGLPAPTKPKGGQGLPAPTKPKGGQGLPAPTKPTLPPVKPTKPAKPARPKPKTDVKPKVDPKPSKEPCEDEINAKNAELERLKKEQAAKDEAARLERERLQAEADAKLEAEKAKQAADQSLVDLKIKSKDKFKERVWVPTVAGGHYETIRSDLKIKVKAKKIRTGEANAIIDNVSEMKADHEKSVNDLRVKYGLIEAPKAGDQGEAKSADSTLAN